MQLWESMPVARGPNFRESSMSKNSNDVQFGLRIPTELRDRINAVADYNMETSSNWARRILLEAVREAEAKRDSAGR